MSSLAELFEMTEVFFTNAMLSTNDYIDYLYKQINSSSSFPSLLGFSSTQKSEMAEEIREKKRRVEFCFKSIFKAQCKLFLDDDKRDELVQLWMNIAGGDYVNHLIETAPDEDGANSLSPKFRSLDVVLQIYIQIELRIIVENILGLIADVLSTNDTEIALAEEVKEETAELAEWVAQYSATRAKNYALVLQTLRTVLSLEKIYTQVSADADKAVADLQRKINRLIKQFAFPLKGGRALKTPLAFSRIPSIRTSVVTSPAPEPFSSADKKTNKDRADRESAQSSRFSSPASEGRPRGDSDSAAPIVNTNPELSQFGPDEDREENAIDIKSLLKQPYVLSLKLRIDLNHEYGKIATKYNDSTKDPNDPSVLVLIHQLYALKMIVQALTASDKLLEPDVLSIYSVDGEEITPTRGELRKSVAKQHTKQALREEGEYLSPQIVEQAFFPPGDAIIFEGRIIQRDENKIFEPDKGYIFDSEPEIKSLYRAIKNELITQMWDRIKDLPLYRDLLLSDIQVRSKLDLINLVKELREKTNYLIRYKLEIMYNNVPLAKDIKPGIIYLYIADGKIKFRALNALYKIETNEISDEQLPVHIESIKSALQSDIRPQLYPDQEAEIFKITSSAGFPPEIDEAKKLSASQIKEGRQRLAIEALLYSVDSDSPQLSATVLELLRYNYPLEAKKVAELINRIEGELKGVLWNLGKEDFRSVIGLTYTETADKKHGPTHPEAKFMPVM